MSRKLALSLLLVMLGLASLDAISDNLNTSSSESSARVTHGGVGWPD